MNLEPDHGFPLAGSALDHPAPPAIGLPSPPTRPGLCGENLAATKGGKTPPQFRLGRARPVGLRPRTSIRGHPRLGAVEAKTWMRGSSPCKTTLTRFLGVPHKCSLQGNFPRAAPPL